MTDNKEIQIWIGNARGFISRIDQEIGMREIQKATTESTIDDIHHVLGIMNWKRCEGVAARQAKRAVVRLALTFNVHPKEIVSRGRLEATFKLMQER